MGLFNKKYIKGLEEKVKLLEEQSFQQREAYAMAVRDNCSLRDNIKALKEENAMLSRKCADLAKEKLDLIERMISMLEKEGNPNEDNAM